MVLDRKGHKATQVLPEPLVEHTPNNVVVPAGDQHQGAIAFCEPGDIITGGGFGVLEPAVVTSSGYSVLGGGGWCGSGSNPGAVNGELVVQVVCLDTTP